MFYLLFQVVISCYRGKKILEFNAGSKIPEESMELRVWLLKRETIVSHCLLHDYFSVRLTLATEPRHGLIVLY